MRLTSIACRNERRHELRGALGAQLRSGYALPASRPKRASHRPKKPGGSPLIGAAKLFRQSRPALYKRAQSLINQDLDKCEYFVGMIWNHWGSKPDDGDGKYTSGFEEEFERAKDRLEQGLMKDIDLYFKEIPEQQLKDMGPSIKQAFAFREKCKEQRKPLYKPFKDAEQFQNLFRAKIQEIGWQEAKQRNLTPHNDADAEQPAKADEQKSGLPDAADAMFGTPAVQFVASLLRRTADWEATTPYEIARLRLVAASISDQAMTTFI